MPRAKLSDAQPIPPPEQQGGKARLSDTQSADDVFQSKAPISVSPHPPTGSIPWMKEKAYTFLGRGANELPSMEGAVGGIVGGLVGGAVDVLGGEVPGALAGAGLGGAHGEMDRQKVFDKFNLDPYADPETKNVGNRIKNMAKEGAGQMAAEAVGQGLGKLMRPTLERSLAKLYNAGGIDYGDGMREGRLKTVINDLMATEKAPGGKAVTIQDLVNTIGKTKEDIGAKADAALSAPVIVGGKTVLLRDIAPNPTPLADLIKDFATKDEGVVKRASLTGNDPSVKAAKAYQQAVKDRALTFEQHPWTYGQLARERIRIGQELDDYYSMTPGEKQAFLNSHPLFEVDKAIADHIRKVTYPEMDAAAGLPKGTTANLQTKRGVLMGMDTEVRKRLNRLQNATVTAQGEGIVDKVSPSGYVTSEGKPGGSFHRIQRLVHTPNGVASADKKVSQAFGHAPLTKVRKAVTSPVGSEMLLKMPVRLLVNPSMPQQKEDDDSPDNQSSAVKPKELIDRAKQMNPSAQGQVAYAHTAVNPDNDHRIVSRDGVKWIDPQTGQQVA